MLIIFSNIEINLLSVILALVEMKPKTSELQLRYACECFWDIPLSFRNNKLQFYMNANGWLKIV